MYPGTKPFPYLTLFGGLSQYFERKVPFMGIEEKTAVKLGVSITLILLLCIIVFISYKNYKDSIYRPISNASDAKKVEITIDRSNVKKLPDILYSNGLIKNREALRVYLKLSGNSGRLKAGKYELTNAMSASQMINKMVYGEVKKDTIKVTIPEGYTVNDIAELLESKGLVSKGKFLDAVKNNTYDYDFLKKLPDRSGKIEGYLFPDTYEFSKDVTAEQIVDRMLSRFNEVFDNDMRKKASEMNMTIDQVVTVASMIEKEAKVAEERPVIAGVIYNRLTKKMPLQIDATVQYSLGKWKDTLSTDDLKVNSPYNTYKITGLPIGPISNPGKASLEAALNPQKSDYLFYVYKFDGTGTHAFSSNYQDFLRDKQKYITSRK